jgi:hypothetical protein
MYVYLYVIVVFINMLLYVASARLAFCLWTLLVLYVTKRNDITLAPSSLNEIYVY